MMSMLQTSMCLRLLELTEVMSDSTQISQCYSGLTAEDYFAHLLEQKKNLES